MQLVYFNNAKKSLALATKVDEVKDIRDKAEALRLYAKQSGETLEMQNQCAEIKLRAERRAGEILREQEKNNQREKRGGDRKSKSHDATLISPPKLSDLGVTKSQSSRWQESADVPEDVFEKHIAEVKDRKHELTSTGVNKLAKKLKKEIKAEQDKRDLIEAQEKIDEDKRRNIESVCDLRVCSCAELLANGIKPDAVITDPPYAKEFLLCFTELAVGCKTADVPLVAVMSGQSYLPEVMQRLCEHLRYRWTLAYLTPGGQAVQQWYAKVNTAWKPVLLFGDAGEWFGDVAVSKPNDNDKRFHSWGQSESGMADLVERLTKPGQLVCDPFLGGGTTAVVSLALGRRFVGCDIDAAHVDKAKARVMA